jgi:hypothetical protein
MERRKSLHKMIGVEVTPGWVRLNCALALRVVTGPGAPSDWGSAAVVGHGNVVALSFIVHNIEDAFTGATARGFAARMSIPRHPSSSHRVTGDVRAMNAAPSNYLTEAAISLQSETETLIEIGRPRGFVMQGNDIPQGQWQRPNFNWGEALDADEVVEVTETPISWEVVIDPYGDGTFGPCFGRSKQVSCVLDVSQPASV